MSARDTPRLRRGLTKSTRSLPPGDPRPFLLTTAFSPTQALLVSRWRDYSAWPSSWQGSRLAFTSSTRQPPPRTLWCCPEHGDSSGPAGRRLSAQMSMLSGDLRVRVHSPVPTQVGKLRAFRPPSPTESLLQQVPACCTGWPGPMASGPCQVLGALPGMLWAGWTL